jgi:hypothetical protein
MAMDLPLHRYFGRMSGISKIYLKFEVKRKIYLYAAYNIQKHWQRHGKLVQNINFINLNAWVPTSTGIEA